MRLATPGCSALSLHSLHSLAHALLCTCVLALALHNFMHLDGARGLRTIAVVQPLPGADLRTLVRNATATHVHGRRGASGMQGAPALPPTEVVVFPEGFVRDTPARATAACCAAAKESNTSVVCPSNSGEGTAPSHVSICSSAGEVILNYTKPAGAAANPTHGADPSPVVALAGARVCVVLGTDVLFMEHMRVLMTRGCEVVFNPTSGNLTEMHGQSLRPFPVPFPTPPPPPPPAPPP